MKPIHTIAVVVGLAATIWGVRMLFTDPAPKPSGDPVAPTADPVREVALDADGNPVPTPQVTILGGPGVNDGTVARDDAHQDEGSSMRAIRNEPRRAQLEEVLNRVDGSSVWIEGVDGPAQEPSKPRRR